MNLVQLLQQSVLENPAKECLRYKVNGQYTSMTYGQVWDQVMHFAVGLQAFGVKPDDKVAILSTNCPEWTISDYAILSLQAVVTPIYPTLPANQVEFILDNADVSYVIVQDAEQFSKIQQYGFDRLKRVIIMGDYPVLRGGNVLLFQDVLAIGKQQEQSLGRPDIDNIPGDRLATIVHTSGTSGNPKGVMLSHNNIVSNIFASLSYLPVEPTDLTLSYLPLSHIFERTVGQYAVLSSGATIAFAESIATIQDDLKTVQPTVFVTVPRLLEKVYSKIIMNLESAPSILRGTLQKGIADRTGQSFAYRMVDRLVYKKVRAGLGGRVRAVVSGGAGLALNINEFFTAAGIPVYEGYGMTETAPVICTNPMNRSKPGMVGRPVPGVEIRIAEDGELLVKGPNVMLGYYKAPEETAKTMDEDGWLHTGDIAEMHQGYVKIVDRKKNILVLATGKNVAPWPIENAISLSPYISEAILLGDGRNYVTALIGVDYEGLKDWAKEQGLADSRAEWLQSPALRRLIAQEVRKQTADFAGFEQPKRISLLQNELTQENGELTPSLKVRNKVIREKYGALIEAMYDGTNYIPVFEDGAGAMAHVEVAASVAAAPTTAAPVASAAVASQAKPSVKQTKSSIWGYAVAGVVVGLAIRFWIGG